MNQDVKQRWLKALRSGDYKQTKASLRKKGAFCCLGVLCDLHAKETKNNWVPATLYNDDDCYLQCAGLPPDDVITWAELLPTDAQSLANMNDHGHSFDEIAKHIEETQ